MITIFSNYIIISLIVSVNTLWTKSIWQKNQNLCIFITIVEFKITVTNVEKDVVVLFDMPLVGFCLFVFCGCFYIKYHYRYPAFYFFHINITEIS